MYYCILLLLSVNLIIIINIFYNDNNYYFKLFQFNNSNNLKSNFSLRITEQKQTKYVKIFLIKIVYLLLYISLFHNNNKWFFWFFLLFIINKHV